MPPYSPLDVKQEDTSNFKKVEENFMGTFGNLNTINSAGFASDNAQIAEF